jgi:hypothetical protein
MNMARSVLLVAAALVLPQAPAVAVTDALTERDIAHALSIAGGSEASRALFHAPYRIAIDDPLIEHLEIVTEFRRFVLAAEEQLTRGNWMMARGGFDAKGRTIKDALQPLTGQLSVRVRLRFHPQNNYAALPAFDILLGEPTLLALHTIRTPHITPATGDPGSRDVVTGATIEVFYNAPTIGDRTLPVRLLFESREVARVSTDFSRVE